MSNILNNNFSEDTYPIRAERLNIIQGNFASIQSALAAPAHIVTWAADCYDNFSDAWSTSDSEFGQSEGFTLDVVAKCSLMEEEYQNARNLGIAIYRNDALHLKEFNFDEPFPDDRYRKINKVEYVLNRHLSHVALGLTNLIPAAIITRLTNAKVDLYEALQAQEKEKIDASRAVDLLNQKFDSDTGILQELRAWWYAIMGKNDSRIGLIGMVNPDYGSGAHVLPAPTGLIFQLSNMTVRWDVMSEATSFEVQISSDGINYDIAYTGENNFFVYEPEFYGAVYLKCRARSSAGFGNFSSVYQFAYYDILPAPTGVNIELIEGSSTNYHLSFSPVLSAATYKIYKSEVTLGDPAGEYVYVTDVTGTVYSGTAVTGKRSWLIIKSANETQMSDPSTAVYLDVTAGPV